MANSNWQMVQRSQTDRPIRLNGGFSDGDFPVREENSSVQIELYKPAGSTNALSVEIGFEQVFKNKIAEKKNVPFFKPIVQFMNAFPSGKIAEGK